jgi:hypothetical protein
MLAWLPEANHRDLRERIEAGVRYEHLVEVLPDAELVGEVLGRVAGAIVVRAHWRLYPWLKARRRKNPKNTPMATPAPEPGSGTEELYLNSTIAQLAGSRSP